MPKEVDVILVNNLEVSGFLNGIINLAFSTSHFIPVIQQGPEVGDEPQLVVSVANAISVNMRMDLWLAQQLRDRLDELIEANTKPAGPAH
jgi:hypothetical protein